LGDTGVRGFGEQRDRSLESREMAKERGIVQRMDGPAFGIDKGM
jgi:hypothetical protein